MQTTVLITGALTGIGRATAIAFAKTGANLVVSGRRPEIGNAFAADLRAIGSQAEFIRADVAHESEVRSLVETTVSRFGRLDIAINNAGTEGTLGPLVDQSIENYIATFSTNVLGVLLSLKHELRAMLEQGSGSIVNLSSIAGQVGVAGGAIYAASKHAVEGFTKSAALEVAARGIRVNAVAPGPVDTDMLDRFVGRNPDVKAGLVQMVPAQRMATPEEIAETILFLASSRSGYLTGQCIAVDGGYTAQ